ncbi:MAG: translation initiation factor IF-3, partial [Planctomycetia bacterium]
MISAEGGQLGIIPTEEALALAREAGLDLVEVAPNEKPPVCRIMDFGKFKYQQKKKQHKTHVHHTKIK